MARSGQTRIVSVPWDFPAGRQKITKLAPSTGIYGKHVGGQSINIAVKLRKGR